ncbi:MAG: hypothetical protein KAH38_00385 [Candidatus Hydrogenedentes bacterium]|nr:hypothetical protein [Candidatus Hydrogenedentota bacterium]
MTDGHDNKKMREADIEFARENRKRIVRFVLGFVCIALSLLVSYRYAAHTRLNDRYLFEAAKDTAWVLDIIGQAEVEPYAFGKHNPQEMRAAITAWSEGCELAVPEEIAAAPTGPLTAWERWSYRALETRRSPTPRPSGPRVQFILRPGILSRTSILSGKINELQSNHELNLSSRKKQLAPLQKELRELRARQRAMRVQKENTEKDTTLSFSFILVPECGAIEIMAIFLAAVISFPTLWRKRLIGLIVGTPIMYGVNIFRLTVLAVIGAMDQSRGRIWFSFAHEYVWQVIYIVFVVAVWLLWVEYIVKGRRT